MHSSIIPSFLYFALYFSVAHSFSVTVGSDTTTQCGSLDVTWTGGQPPFEITLTPAFNIPRNISVPSAAFQSTQGSYQISPIPFLNETKFLVTMSDATGFGTGGTSDLISVGKPDGNASCDTSNPSIPFSFGLPSSLQECSPYVFNGYDGAILPVTITGYVPGGDFFFLHPPSSAGTNFTWIADVEAGTTIVFSMTDAKGNSGGSSDASVVALSNDASCLNANSPTSTISSAPSATSPSTSSPTQTSSVSTGTIVGAAVGAILAISAIVSLAVFYIKRRRYGRSSYGFAPTRDLFQRNSVELDPGVDNFQHPPIYPFPYQTDSITHLAPPVMLSSPSTRASYQETSSTAPSAHASELPYTYQQHSRASSNANSFAALGDIASSSISPSTSRKAAMARASYKPTRFIVHTDADEHVPEDEAEVIELPPQYSERRAPVAGHTEERLMSSTAGPSSANPTYSPGQHADEPPRTISHLPPG